MLKQSLVFLRASLIKNAVSTQRVSISYNKANQLFPRLNKNVFLKCSYSTFEQEEPVKQKENENKNETENVEVDLEVLEVIKDTPEPLKEEPVNIISTSPEIVESAVQADPGSFENLEGVVHPELIRSILKLGFEKMSPVQEKAIKPLIETQTGLVARAKTGTGKTLAFGIPVLHDALCDSYDGKARMYNNQHVRSLIIAPTRDLANQIAAEIATVLKKHLPKKYSKNTSVRDMTELLTVVGGESRRDQVSTFNRVNKTPLIVVATPGRFLDIINERAVADRFHNLNYFVLDEADRLLDDGFKKDLLDIDDNLKSLQDATSTYKTVLFSATIDKNVLQFSRQMLGKDYVYINTVDPNEPEAQEKIDQSVVVVDDMFQCYVSAAEFIANHAAEKDPSFKSIIFLPTIKSVQFFTNFLKRYLAQEYDLKIHRNVSNHEANYKRKIANKTNKDAINVIEFHGQLTQARRDSAVRDFKNPNKISILVTSNVGARGMDFPNVSDVIQVNLPSQSADYIHRIGRTARGSAEKGNAILFIVKSEKRGLNELYKRKVKFLKEFTYDDIVKNESAEDSICEITSNPSFGFPLKKSQDYESSQPRNVECIRELLVAQLGYFKSICGAFNLRMTDLAKSTVSAYEKFLGTEEKLYVNQDFAKRALGMNSAIYREVFGSSFRANKRVYEDEDIDEMPQNFGRRNNDYSRHDNKHRSYGNNSQNRRYDQRGGRQQNKYNSRNSRNSYDNESMDF